METAYKITPEGPKRWPPEPITDSGGGPLVLDDLTDVTTPSPSVGDILQFDGSEWVNEQPSVVANLISINDLSDVDSPTPSADDLLIFNGVNYENIDSFGLILGIASNLELDDLNNVDCGSPNNNDIVFFNSLSNNWDCLLYTSPSPRDQRGSRMPSSA